MNDSNSVLKQAIDVLASAQLVDKKDTIVLIAVNRQAWDTLFNSLGVDDEKVDSQGS